MTFAPDQTPKQKIESLLSRAKRMESHFRSSDDSLNQPKLDPTLRLDAIHYWLTNYEVVDSVNFDRLDTLQLGEIIGTLETTLRLAKTGKL